MHEILCLGNALIDCFLTIKHPDLHCRVNNTSSELCFPLGAKIPVSDTSFLLGGNACNISVGLSRLQIKSTLLAEIGTDSFSDMILTGLTQEKVETGYVQQIAGPSSFAVGINVHGDRTLFIEHVTRAHAFVFPETTQATWLYVNSLGNVWQTAYAKALSYAKEHEMQIVFSPGTPQLEEGIQSFSEMLSQSMLVLCNKEEAQKMLQTDETEIDAMLYSLQKLGPKTVVITDGKNGSYAKHESNKSLFMPIVDAVVVERTGAGDAYAAGFLGAFSQKRDITTAMQWGTHNAAAVVGKIGSQPGLLTTNEIEQQAKVSS